MSTARPLFAIGGDLVALYDLIDEVGAEVTDATVDEALTAWLAELHDGEAAKLDGYVRLLRQLEMERAAAQAEAKLLTAKARARDKREEWLKARMLAHLQATGRTKVTTAAGRTIYIQANSAVPFDIDEGLNPAALPDRFCRTERTVDRVAVKAALEAGEEVPFARFGERGVHLRVR